MSEAAGVGARAPAAPPARGAATLRVSVGQCSEAGRKTVNQDFHGCLHPNGTALACKGVAVALADGISTSAVSAVAAETAVKNFLDDYYATPESWPVKKAGQRVLAAINSWLFAQTRKGPHRFDLERGYVCTFSAVVIKGRHAHLFHVGDARIAYLSGERLEPLTTEHRLWVSASQSYLSRALGMREHLELDYHHYRVEEGAILVLMTDGVYEHVTDADIARAVHDHGADLDRAARRIVDTALTQGSDDNLTVQIVRIDRLAPPGLDSLRDQAAELPFPPALHPRQVLDGYRIVREIHSSPRSHVYLAEEPASGRQVVLKTPSVERRDDPAYLERLLMEEWVAARIDSPHLVKPAPSASRRTRLYTVFEYIDGQTLEQWLHDHPQPDLATVRRIVEQVAKGLRALHRREMIHQDLRPANILLDRDGNVTLIDFGAVRVKGLAEIALPDTERQILGTAPYTAPEYFLGEPGTPRADLYSLGVIAYQMLSGRLPYGTTVAKTTRPGARGALRYRSLREANPAIPPWVDGCLKKAVHPKPAQRYESLSEFLYDLTHPNPRFVDDRGAPLLERHPLRFWQGLSLLLFVALLALAATHPAVTG